MRGDKNGELEPPTKGMEGFRKLTGEIDVLEEIRAATGMPNLELKKEVFYTSKNTENEKDGENREKRHDNR